MPDRSDSDAVQEAVMAFLVAQTPAEVRRVFESRRAILLSDAALAYLQEVIKQAYRDGKEEHAQGFELCLAFLQEARRHGTDAAMSIFML